MNKFKVFDGKENGYSVELVGDMYVLTHEKCGFQVIYPKNDSPTNWINCVERIPYGLEFPIIYRHKLWPDDRRILLRGSPGKVSVFEEGNFDADEWDDAYVEETIASGMWLVESVGNVSCGDYLEETA